MDTTTIATGMMSQDLALSLRSWPPEDPGSQSLPSIISRINTQKGSFRNITEGSLEEEIRILEAGETQGNDEEALDEAQDAKGRREEIIAAREEIIKQVGRAHLETLFALDFVSLLLSKETPRQAELTMSTYIKQNAPMGSLGMDKMQEPPIPSDAEMGDRNLVARGWKLEGLNSAADSLLESATKLGQEMEQEARYWEQILSVTNKGWSVCRLPRERHSLGVRYGFAEAAAEFKDRGLAALRRSTDGNITLDQGLSSSQPKVVRVRIQRNDTVIGTSTVSNVLNDAEPSVEDLILRARNTIFEEELFHEITREARVLANQGVRNPGSTIQIPTAEDQIVLIDRVPLDEALPDGENTTSNNLAESIALSLRILLSHAHRQTLRRRSQLPPPITERKRPTPIQAILRPILSHLQHTTALSTLAHFFTTLTLPLHSASLPFTTSTTSAFSAQILSHAVEVTAKSSSPIVESLVETLSRPLESTTTITLPCSTTLTLKTRTHLGTTYELVSPSSSMLSADLPPSMHFTSPSELRSYIVYVLTISLVSLIASYTPFSSPKSPSKEVTATVTGEVDWIPSLQVGELTKAFNKFGRNKLLIVEVESGKLGLRWGWVDGKGENGTFIWDQKDDRGVGGVNRVFREVIREADGAMLDAESIGKTPSLCTDSGFSEAVRNCQSCLEINSNATTIAAANEQFSGFSPFLDFCQTALVKDPSVASALAFLSTKGLVVTATAALPSFSSIANLASTTSTKGSSNTSIGTNELEQPSTVSSISSAATAGTTNESNTSPHQDNYAWVAGAVVGGLGLLALLALTAVFVRRRTLRAHAKAKADSDHLYFSGGKAQLHGDDIKPKELNASDRAQLHNDDIEPQELPALETVGSELDAGPQDSETLDSSLGDAREAG
ncbi:MAG: hypothetical protein M1812_002564 [Candelaria pacifica]|nr:MAG: hypothetical protein M1812_002564 [Candelaria pacifica]